MIYRVHRPTERDCGDFKFLIDLNRELALDTILSMCLDSMLRSTKVLDVILLLFMAHSYAKTMN